MVGTQVMADKQETGLQFGVRAGSQQLLTITEQHDIERYT